MFMTLRDVRRMGILAVLSPVLLAVSPSSASAGLVCAAGVCTETITGLSQSMGDLTPFDINALPFDPAVGTLLSASIEISGIYTPMNNLDLTSDVPANTIATLTSRMFVEEPVSSVTIPGVTFPDQVLTVGPASSGIAVNGAATPVDETFNLPDLAAMEVGVAPYNRPSGVQDIVQYGFRSGVILSAGTFSSGSDLTTFTGQATITYNYAVPEPASSLIFSGAVATLAWRRRRQIKAKPQSA